MTEPSKILKISLTYGESIRVRWLPGGSEALTLYDISRRAVAQAGDMVRERLDALVALPWSGDSEPPGLALAIQGLADAGANLFEALFTARPGDEASFKGAALAKRWFEENITTAPDGDWVVQIIQTQTETEIVPWGLAYTQLADEALSELNPSFEACRGFWCISLRCAITGATMSGPAPGRIDSAEFQVGAILEHDDERITRFVEEASGARNASLERLKRQLFKRKADLPELDDLHVFWYVFLNTSDRGGYRLGEQSLEPADLFDTSNAIRLLMLDGDAVIRNGRDSRWVEQFLNKSRLTGCIAAEADITNPALRYFGWGILNYLLHARCPLIEAMYDARRLFWPQSLFYGVYCNPLQIYIDPPPKSAVEHVDQFIGFQKRLSLEASTTDTGR